MFPLGRLRPEVVRGATGRVLEVGSGTGLNFEHYRPTVTVDAVDPDPHMLRRAAGRIRGRDIRLHEAGAEQLPFDDDVFDTVVITFALCTIPDLAGALREVHRVARPGAEVRFAEHVRSSVGWIHGGQRLLNPLWQRLAGGCHLDRDSCQWLLDHGFVELACQPRGSAWSPLPVLTGTARVSPLPSV